MIVPIAIGIIIGGLLFCFLCTNIRNALLSTVVYYTGIVLVILGLVLLLAPLVIWLRDQLVAMFGLH